MRIRSVFFALGIALIMGYASQSHANTVLFTDNFDTENGGTADVLNYNSFTNWDVTEGTVDLIGNGGGWDLHPINGLYVDLDGSTNDAGIFSTKQTFNFEAGKTYTLEFYLGGSKRGTDENVTVSLGSLFNKTYNIKSDAGLTLFSEHINGSSNTSSKIVFSNSDGDNMGAILDNVKLTATPVPAALWIFGSGLLGLAGISRRKKNRP